MRWYLLCVYDKVVLDQIFILLLRLRSEEADLPTRYPAGRLASKSNIIRTEAQGVDAPVTSSTGHRCAGGRYCKTEADGGRQ
jgi:hypothetical protein